MRATRATGVGLALALALPAAAQDGGAAADRDIAALTEGCVQEEKIILRIESCTRLIRAAPESEGNLAWVFNNRGLAFETVRNFERALADYNTALLLDPTYAVGYNNRGNVHARLGDLDAAIADHSQAVEIDPDYADAWYNRGADYEETGDLVSAVEDYTRALEADGDYIQALVGRAAALCKLGEVDRAVADRLELIERDYFEPRDLQEYLAATGFYEGAIDGLFGPGSRAALTRWTEAGCP